jgi:hypothetical protein
MGKKIEFVSMVKGLEDIEECRPKPAKSFTPQWFKDLPASPNQLLPTVRVCPSFTDYFSLGYVMPMWTDFKLKYQDEKWSWESSDQDFRMSSHPNEQFIKYTTPTFNGVEGQFVFKAVCPWRIITPKGWSVLQLPLFYDFNNEFSVLPGVIDTDIYSQANQQILYHANGKEIDIKRGTPLALYVPFQRESSFLDIDVRSATQEDIENFNKVDNIFRQAQEYGLYRKMQRKRDKG